MFLSFFFFRVECTWTCTYWKDSLPFTAFLNVCGIDEPVDLHLISLALQDFWCVCAFSFCYILQYRCVYILHTHWYTCCVCTLCRHDHVYVCKQPECARCESKYLFAVPDCPTLYTQRVSLPGADLWKDAKFCKALPQPLEPSLLFIVSPHCAHSSQVDLHSAFLQD